MHNSGPGGRHYTYGTSCFYDFFFLFVKNTLAIIYEIAQEVFFILFLTRNHLDKLALDARSSHACRKVSLPPFERRIADSSLHNERQAAK